ncbi:hypothetical protein HPB48_005007 [Haemaphysalis longicornis]|uniref:Uncharacterized protein n=1 Tax=Haemaphysalis longicornis TaxID=44386 RepID=A0A9J6G4D6_HAELO|nr:hypothetical protein HPB48_005007 [Haemaphysalis longicornis]
MAHFLRSYDELHPQNIVQQLKSSAHLTLCFSGSSKYQMFPEGELYIRDVDKSFSYRSYRCQTRDKLTGESTRNSLPGRLIVTGKNELLLLLILFVHCFFRVLKTRQELLEWYSVSQNKADIIRSTLFNLRRKVLGYTSFT